MFIVFLGSVILKDTPLNAVQMLWVNLIMDTFAALALATEPPQEAILERQPYKKNAPIVTQVMWRNVFGHAIYQAIVILFVIFAGQVLFCENYETMCAKFGESGECEVYNPFYTQDLYYTKALVKMWESKDLTKEQYDPEMLMAFSCQYQQSLNEEFNCTAEITSVDSPFIVLPKDIDLDNGDFYTQKIIHYTYVFQTFVFMQIFNQINARKLEEHEINVFSGFFNNMLFIYVTFLTIIIQMAMVEYGGDFVKTYPLNREQNMQCLLIGALELLNGLILKFLPLKWF